MNKKQAEKILRPLFRAILSRLVKETGYIKENISLYILKEGEKPKNPMHPKDTFHGKFGISHFDGAKAQIIIYYDVCGTKKELVLTLLHEFIHVLLGPLTLPLLTRVKKNKKRVNKGYWNNIEEDVVCNVERLFRTILKCE